MVENKSNYQKTIEKIKKIEKKLAELHDLLDNENFMEELSSIEDNLDRLTRKINEKIIFAASRVNFRDRGYKLIKVIDGDTISVEPPSELKIWLNDIIVRLYGIDAPEIDTKKGKLYKDILKDILDQSNYKKIIIIWDREKPTNKYSGFPTNSFIRSNGNIFLEFDDRLIYLNSLLLMLPEVLTYYNKNNLIKGRRYLKRILDDYNHSFECISEKPKFIQESFQNLIEEVNFTWINNIPLCLVSFPLEFVQYDSESPISLLNKIIESVKKTKCPFYFLQEILEDDSAHNKINDHKINPFDIILLATEKWKNNIQNKEGS